MDFIIRKDIYGSWWHDYNNDATKVNISDFEAVIDSVANTFIIQCKNGSNVPTMAISIVNVKVINQIVSNTPISFSGAVGLKNLLTSLSYTPYFVSGGGGGGAVDSVNGQTGVVVIPLDYLPLAGGTMDDGADIFFDNGSALREGTYDFGGDGGISRICSVDYEDMWQAGIRHVFDNNGLIRHSTNCFDVIPDSSFDNTLRFKIDSLWTLDNGTTYKCTDASTGAAVWELYTFGTIPTLDQVLSSGSIGSQELSINDGTGSNIYLSPLGIISTGRIDGVDAFVQLYSDGYIALQSSSTDGVIEIYSNSNNNYSILIPEKATDSVQTLAFLSDITTPTLQQVTTEGAITNNSIIVTDNSENETILQYNGINFLDLDEGGNTLLRFINTSAANQEIEIRGLGGTMALLSDIPAAGVTSVGLTMPSAFTVTNSPITSSGDIAVTGAGLVSQYVRGDGSLANFPTSSGGGSSLSFYLNGSVSQGTIGGVAFREMDRTPILGAGTDFTINANGYIQSFITDANVPNLLEIPAGNWNFETYFSASSGGGSPSFYLELYKWNGTTLSLIASNSANPEFITGGINTDLYVSALAVPQTTLLATDRLAVRIYVTHSGRTITLHTENGNLCEVLTTFTTGLTALNGLTEQVQNLATGTSGTDFGIVSSGSTHTFNLPTASASNRGLLTSADWSTFNAKQNDLETFNRTQGVYYFQDFLNGPVVGTIEGVDISTRVVSGGSGGETISAALTFPNRTSQQGVLQLTTGTNAAASLNIRVGSFNNASGMYFGNGEVVFEAYVNVDTLSTAAQRFVDFIGWSIDNSVLTSRCYQFIYDEGGLSTNGGAASPNWKCCSFNGATRVNTDTGVPVVAGQWYKLRIVVNAAGTQVNYLIDGVNVATHTSGVGVTVMAAKVIHNKYIGTTNRTFFIDYLMIKQIFTTPR